MMKLAMVFSAAILAGFSAQATAQEESQTPLQGALGAYRSAVDALTEDVAQRADDASTGRRTIELLDHRIGLLAYKYAMLDSNVAAIASGRSALNISPGGISAEERKRAYTDTMGGYAFAAYFLCEPLIASIDAKGPIAPLKAISAAATAARARPRGSGVGLLIEALGGDYDVDFSGVRAAQAKAESLGDRVFKTCRQDIEDAWEFYELSGDAGGQEFLQFFFGSASALKGLIEGVNRAVDGVARYIHNKRVDEGIREFIKTIEPAPCYPAQSRSVASEAIKAREALQIAEDAECREIEQNVVRFQMEKLKESLKGLNKAQRGVAAREYYVAFRRFESDYEDFLNIAKDGLDIGDDGIVALTLSESAAISTAQPFRERHDAVVAYVASSDLTASANALIEAAATYDAAFRASGGSTAIAALDQAWNGLVRNAYEGQGGNLLEVLTFIGDLETAIEEVRTEYNTFEANIRQTFGVRKNDEKDKDEEAEAES